MDKITQDKINTLKYWHTEEFFIPQELDPPKKIKQSSRNRTAMQGNLTEIISEMKRLVSSLTDDRYTWEFIVFGGLYPVDNIRDTIEKHIPQSTNNQFEERTPKGLAATYAVSFNSSLLYSTGSFQCSTSPWAIQEVEKYKNFKRLDYKAFDKTIEEIGSYLDEAAEDKEYEVEKFLSNLEEKVVNTIGNILYDKNMGDKTYQLIATKSKKSNKNNDEKANDTDILNSFFIEDLSKAIHNAEKGNSNLLLMNYLEMGKHPQRIDVRERENIEKVVYPMLRPDNLPDGCWATSGGYPLVFSQQFAINAIANRLSRNRQGMYSVNGSPGTGKTTMLRDLIAHLITERAKAIALLNSPQDIFSSGKKIAWKLDVGNKNYYELNSKLLGYEMVVSSSNNGAVENVTMEIPDIESIDDKWLDKFDYFRELGSRVIGRDAWGIGAAKLGNSSNKQEFINNFLHKKNEYGEQINPQTGKKERVIVKTHHGMLSLLEEASTSGGELSWVDAKNSFNTALWKVQKMKADINEKIGRPLQYQRNYHKLNQELKKTKDNILLLRKEVEQGKQASQRQKKLIAELEIGHSKLINAENKNKVAISDQKSLESGLHEELKRNHEMKPSWFEEFFIDTVRAIFGREKEFVRWKNEREKTVTLIDSTKKKIKQYEAQSKKIKKEINTTDNEIRKTKSALKQTQEKITTNSKKINDKQQTIDTVLSPELASEKRKYHQAIKEVDQFEKADIDIEHKREISSLWTKDKKFQEARANVFVQALKLHRATLESKEVALKVKENLHRMREVLNGSVSKKPQNEHAVYTAWATLFLCVPVVSTTFASFGRLFGHLWREKLGWLLVDEAGQATAKACVGALSRVQRAVVVGDPLQLEPIVGLPGTVQEIIRKNFNAPVAALSEHTSVQTKADFIEEYGTYLKFDNEMVWVGSPLRVHRRCHSPMFEISNTTTYKGLMIQGKPDDTSDLEPSKWVDVLPSSNEGHWIPDEGEKVNKIIEYLNKKGVSNDNIYLISPFRDVVQKLRFQFHKTKIKVGTIHTVQGKEADVVILVMGSDPKNDGARVWASSKPNLLNVAATRAKVRLYIVGNRDKWKDKKYFKDAIELLDNNVRK